MAPVTESHVIEGGDSSILTAPLPPIMGPVNDLKVNQEIAFE